MVEITPKNASIETCTACNHSCIYCPVSEFPSKQLVMDLPLFNLAMDRIGEMGRKMKRVSFNHYNEPLLDPLLVDRIKIAIQYDFFNHILINTNLGYLPEELPEKLVFARNLLEFNVNLPTTNKERYLKLHGAGQYENVEQNLLLLANWGFKMRINVQANPFTTEEDYNSVLSKFGNIFPIERVFSNSRVSLIKEIKSWDENGPGREKLMGCLIDRPINYIHIGVHGEIFFCCQDFFKRYQLGFIQDGPLEEILTSGNAKEYLGYLYGEKDVPAGFICRTCEYAIRKPKGKERE